MFEKFYEFKLKILELIFISILSIYPKFYKQIESKLTATKILIKYAEMCEKIESLYKLSSREVLEQLFNLSVELILEYTHFSSKYDAKISAKYGDINDFLNLSHHLSILEVYYREYYQKKALTIQKNKNQTDSEKTILDLTK